MPARACCLQGQQEGQGRAGRGGGGGEGAHAASWPFQADTGRGVLCGHKVRSLHSQAPHSASQSLAAMQPCTPVPSGGHRGQAAALCCCACLSCVLMVRSCSLRRSSSCLRRRALTPAGGRGGCQAGQGRAERRRQRQQQDGSIRNGSSRLRIELRQAAVRHAKALCPATHRDPWPLSHARTHPPTHPRTHPPTHPPTSHQGSRERHQLSDANHIHPKGRGAQLVGAGQLAVPLQLLLICQAGGLQQHGAVQCRTEQSNERWWVQTGWPGLLLAGWPAAG